MSFIFTLYHRLLRFRSPERNSIAAIIDDQPKVQREIRFLIVRLAVFFTIALAVIVGSIISIRQGVSRIEDHQLLQARLYSKIESIIRLSHDVTDGASALKHIQSLIPKDDNFLPFLRALEVLAKETGNKISFRFEQGIPTPAPDMPPYRFIRYTITLEGDARSFLRYLVAFDELPYLAVLDAFTITSDRGISEPKAMIQIQGKLYVQ